MALFAALVVGGIGMTVAETYSGDTEPAAKHSDRPPGHEPNPNKPDKPCKPKPNKPCPTYGDSFDDVVGLPDGLDNTPD